MRSVWLRCRCLALEREDLQQQISMSSPEACCLLLHRYHRHRRDRQSQPGQQPLGGLAALLVGVCCAVTFSACKKA